MLSKKSNKLLWPIIIICLAIFIRFFHLATLPSILNRDEAALAFNAYSILKAGQDEWGNKFPIYLKSFGDYKLAIYPYLIIPFFLIFGINDFSVRLPAALAGLFLIIIYLLQQKKRPKTQIFIICLLTFLFSPVFFYYSRMAWEAMVSLVFFLSCIYFLKKATLKTDLTASLFFLLSIFTYNIPLIIWPFFFLIIFWERFIYKKPRQGLVFVLMIYLISFVFLLQLTSQKSGISIFNDETINMSYPAYREQFPGAFKTLLGNKYIYYAQIVLKNFLATFTYTFLVKGGGKHPWHQIPYTGHIFNIVYFCNLIYISIILFQIIKTIFFTKKIILLNKIKSKRNLLFLIICLLPSIITVDAPHATRSLYFFYFFLVIFIEAVEYFVSIIKEKKHKQIFTNLIIICLVIEASLYLYKYFYKYPHLQTALHTGFDTILQSQISKKSGQEISIIDPDGYQYILTAWYSKIDPVKFLKTVKRQAPDRIGFYYVESFANFNFFRQITDPKNANTIIYYNDDEEIWQTRN